MCFVFDTIPSGLNVVYWSHTMADLKVKIKLKVGYTSVTMTQDYLSLLKVAGQIFGGEQKEKPKLTQDEFEAERQLNALFG